MPWSATTPKAWRACFLTEGLQATLKALVPRGSDLEKDGISRFTWAYVYSAIHPATGGDVTLVMPTVSSEALSIFLEGFGASLPPHAHAVLVLDQAGWHGTKALRILSNITLVPPPYSPELNLVERVWLHLCDRYLSHRLIDDYEAIADTCCSAWIALPADRENITLPLGFPMSPASQFIGREV